MKVGGATKGWAKEMECESITCRFVDSVPTGQAQANTTRGKGFEKLYEIGEVEGVGIKGANGCISDVA